MKQNTLAGVAVVIVAAGLAVAAWFLLPSRDAPDPDGNESPGCNAASAADGSLKLDDRVFDLARERPDPVTELPTRDVAEIPGDLLRIEVAGRVTDETGLPAADIHVEFIGAGRLNGVQGAARTRPDGTYRLLAWERENARSRSDVTAGYVCARADDGRFAISGQWTFEEAPAVDAPDLVLEIAGTISGRVTGPDGEAVPGAKVAARSAGAVRTIDESGRTVSVKFTPLRLFMYADEQGYFQFPPLPVANYRVTVDDGGYFGLNTDARVAELTVESASVWFDLQVIRSSYVRGVLTDASGLPVSQAIVTLIPVDENGNPIESDMETVRAGFRRGDGEVSRFDDGERVKVERTAVTDGMGRFGFHRVSPRTKFLLVSRVGGEEIRLENVQASEQDVLLVLPLISSIAGGVTDAETGRALSFFDVRVARGGGETESPLRRVADDRVFPFHENGAFRLVNPGAGDFVLRISAAGYMPAEIRIEGFREGEFRQAADVALKPVCRLTTEIRRGGRAVPLEPVLVVWNGRVVAEGSTDEFGEAGLGSVAPGVYELRVLSSRGETWTTEIEVPARRTASLSVELPQGD